MTELLFLPAVRLAHLIRSREISCTELLELHLDHIRLQNPSLNAIVTLDENGARRRAQEADQALAKGVIFGPLHGLPMTLKDAFATSGLRTTAGFAHLSDYIPAEDSTVARRLRCAGAVILGKSNVPAEMKGSQTDNPVFGRTNNPWNHAFTPGGSTGGGAAALAAGMTSLEVGSDMGGSIRIPANFCGVFGLKPTENLISTRGHIPDLPDTFQRLGVMNSAGPLSRSVEDLNMALHVLAGASSPVNDTPTCPIRELPRLSIQQLRIAWAPTFPGVPASHETRDAIEALAADMERQGAQVEQTLPETSFEHQFEAREELLELVTDVIYPARGGASSPLERYLHALERRDKFIRVWEEFFEAWDVLLCPISPSGAFKHIRDGDPIPVDGILMRYELFNRHSCIFNLTGHPAIAVPVTTNSSGLPLGAQLVGRRWDDERLIQIASEVTELTGGFRQPPLSATTPSD